MISSAWDLVREIRRAYLMATNCTTSSRCPFDDLSMKPPSVVVGRPS